MSKYHNNVYLIPGREKLSSMPAGGGGAAAATATAAGGAAPAAEEKKGIFLHLSFKLNYFNIKLIVWKHNLIF